MLRCQEHLTLLPVSGHDSGVIAHTTDANTCCVCWVFYKVKHPVTHPGTNHDVRCSTSRRRLSREEASPSINVAIKADFHRKTVEVIYIHYISSQLFSLICPVDTNAAYFADQRKEPMQGCFGYLSLLPMFGVDADVSSHPTAAIKCSVYQVFLEVKYLVRRVHPSKY